MFEGIGPAVRSGILAAEAIIDGKPYGLGTVDAYSWPTLCPPGIIHKALSTILGGAHA